MTDTGMKVWRDAKRAHDGCKMQCMDMPDALAAAVITAAMAQDKARIAQLEEALQIFQSAAYPVAAEINSRGYNWSEAYLDQALTHSRQTRKPQP